MRKSSDLLKFPYLIMDELGTSVIKSSALHTIPAMRKLLNKRPMPGYVEHTTVLVWVGPEADPDTRI